MHVMRIFSCLAAQMFSDMFSFENVICKSNLHSLKSSLWVFCPRTFLSLQESQSAPLPLVTCHHHLSAILCHRRREEDAFQCHNAPLVSFSVTVPLSQRYCCCCCCCCCPGTRHDGGQFAADSCLLCRSPPAGWIWMA